MLLHPPFPGHCGIQYLVVFFLSLADVVLWDQCALCLKKQKCFSPVGHHHGFLYVEFGHRFSMKKICILSYC